MHTTGSIVFLAGHNVPALTVLKSEEDETTVAWFVGTYDAREIREATLPTEALVSDPGVRAEVDPSVRAEAVQHLVEVATQVVNKEGGMLAEDHIHKLRHAVLAVQEGAL